MALLAHHHANGDSTLTATPALHNLYISIYIESVRGTCLKRVYQVPFDKSEQYLLAQQNSGLMQC